jgi:hypothetical protein
VIRLKTNGELTSEWAGCEVAKGYLGLEAEGHRIQFRRLRLEPLP